MDTNSHAVRDGTCNWEGYVLASGIILHHQIVFHTCDAELGSKAARVWEQASACDLWGFSANVSEYALPNAWVGYDPHHVDPVGRRVPFLQIFLPDPRSILCAPEDVDEAIQWFLGHVAECSTPWSNPNLPPFVLHVKLGHFDTTSFAGVYAPNSPDTRPVESARDEASYWMTRHLVYEASSPGSAAAASSPGSRP